MASLEISGTLFAERAVAFRAIGRRHQFLGHEYVVLITFR